MSEKNGGPAFPCLYVKHKRGEVGNNEVIREYGEGVTLRDYFAAKALQGELASQTPSSDKDDDFYTETEEDCQDLAGWCYQMADAMLKARNE